MMLRTLADLLFPNTCFGCNALSDGPVCQDCLQKLDYINGQVCEKCGKPVDDEVAKCHLCKTRRLHFDCARSLFIYHGVAVDLIKGLKYKGGRFLGKTLLLCRSQDYFNQTFDYDLITCIPSRVLKFLQRGYNPAEEIALELSRLSGKPYSSLLLYARPVIDQTKLGREQRARNLKKAFKVKALVKGRKILIVDDVFTTGSTVSQAALALKKAGARKVSTFTLAGNF